MSFWNIMLAGLAGGSLPLIGVLVSLRHARALHVSARMLEDRHSSIRRMLEAEKHFFFSILSLLTSYPLRSGGLKVAEVYDEFFREYYKLIDALAAGSVYAAHRENPEVPLFDFSAFSDCIRKWITDLIGGIPTSDKDTPLPPERIASAVEVMPKMTAFFDQLRNWAQAELSPEGLALLSREALRPSIWSRCRRFLVGRHKTSSSRNARASQAASENESGPTQPVT